jgi:hypothetical protein
MEPQPPLGYPKFAKPGTWTPIPCPVCHQGQATGHVLYFAEPKPSGFDLRTPIGEGFWHEDGKECQRRVC